MIIWDRADHLLKAERHFNDTNTYYEVQFGEDDLVKIVAVSNIIFTSLLSRTLLFSKECK